MGALIFIFALSKKCTRPAGGEEWFLGGRMAVFGRRMRQAKDWLREILVDIKLTERERITVVNSDDALAIMRKCSCEKIGSTGTA
uniref:Uncharacterized protein n=1 Tax=Candidatus Kentrum sp. FM TaxID=2126340 RepID=A0A450RW59_9GAMM|nr:MAG: hypothetical protein BECKFM1743A_GA0114220_1000119 [Candidatus Kentron sp. FM]VFJ43363.1 MAG: hypothetical protein BECKFM1743C_GA0114222_1000119 [Candidatus Kentron sp. FM]VFK05514.1 MAG: hypothetical protein BECKFM1743B_GA0114221_1000119 [Candidatus Kentron sp. FM]